MKSKYFSILTTLLLCFLPINGQEGHPNWWWDVKGRDFIVEGVITYDPAKYYELNPVNVEGKDRKYYWIVGNIKADRIWFINKTSQHLESYRQYLKEIDKNHPVLIPAYPRAMFSSAAPPTYSLHPILGLDITKEPTIFSLSEIYIFPILNLKLESVVPQESLGQAKELIDKRKNNFLRN